MGRAPAETVLLKSQTHRFSWRPVARRSVVYTTAPSLLLAAGQLVFGVQSVTETQCIILMAPAKVINTNENCSKDIQKCLRRKLYNALHLLCAFYHTQRTQRRSPCSELRIKLLVCQWQGLKMDLELRVTDQFSRKAT